MKNRRKIKELEDRVWKLENPPKPIGTKVKLEEGQEWVIVDFELVVYWSYSFFYLKKWEYTLYNKKTDKTIKRFL